MFTTLSNLSLKFAPFGSWDAPAARPLCQTLSELPDVLIQDVADALDIHPFMLSRWRKQAREGLIVTKGVKLDDETVAELKRLRDLEKKYKVLQQEHELLKKAIRFASDQKRKSSGSSKQTGKTTPSR